MSTPGERRADHLVLFELDGRDDVEHHAGARPLELGEQRVAATETDLAELCRAVAEHVVGDRQHAARFDHEVTAADQTARVAGACLIEGFGDRRPPLHDHRIGTFVLDVTAPDVPVLAVLFVDPSEQQRPGRVAEQRDASPHRDLVVEILEAAGGHDPVEHVLRSGLHRGERRVRGVDEGLLDRELVGHHSPWASRASSGKLCAWPN